MRTRADSHNHAKLIAEMMRAPRGPDAVDDIVRASWSRCLNTYSLDPLMVRRPSTVDGSDLKARRDRLGVVLPIARIEIENLGKLMQHSEYSILLTDRDGVIMSYLGDSGFSDAARRCGFREGVIWSEREMGTNGMGTCLMTRRPVVIHRADHFLEQNTQLTCSAAPIFDMRGELLAALDISGASANTQTHTLALVDMAAQNVENRALLDACKEFHVVRFHRCAEFVSTPGEGVLAFDDQGIIKGANRGALQLLRQREHESLIGKRIDRILETDLSTLFQLASRRGYRPESLTAHTGGQRWFATVHPPAEAVRAAGAAKATEYGAALECLRSTDQAMIRNLSVLRRVIDHDISILLLGETGTGKGYCARAIHNASRRADKPFVAVNCAAIPETLIESELFGHKPGAFTGAAREGNSGRIVQANGGTLFLDEIGDMPLQLQARLLNAIEDREIMPLGGSKMVSVDVRIISATQRDPVQLIANGVFRDDLYYRLNGITIRMPPLRQRTDIAELIGQVLRAETGPDRSVTIDPALLGRLVRYSWPGNVRQVRNVLRTMLAMCSSNCLSLADLNESWLDGDSQAVALGADGESALSDAECEALRRTLETMHWNVSAAAACLHVSRRTMYRKMHRHGLMRHPEEGMQCGGSDGNVQFENGR